MCVTATAACAAVKSGQHSIPKASAAAGAGAPAAVWPEGPTPDSLVPNGSLEQVSRDDPKRPAAWRSSSWGTNTVEFAYDADAHGGNEAVRVTISSYSSGDAKWLFDAVPVTPGGSYIFRDFYKSTVASKVVAAFQRPDGSNAYQTLVAKLAPSADWKSCVATFTAPSDAARLSVYHLIADVGTLEIDDIGLLPARTADLVAGVPNGSFEQALDLDATQPLAWHTGSSGQLSASFSYGNTGHTGRHSVNVTVSDYSSGDAKWYFDPQPVTPSTRYAYSDYYIATDPSFVTARITRMDATFLYLKLATVPPSTSYKAAKVAFLTPADATAVSVFRGLSSNGTLTFDDAALTTLPPAPLVNGVPNGDLEQEAFPGATTPAAFYSNVWGMNDAVFSYEKSGHSGGHSIRVEIGAYTSGNAAWYFDAQPIDPSRVYQVTEYYRSNVDTSVQAQVSLTDGSTVLLQLPLAIAAADWTRYSARLYLPNNARDVTLFHGLARVGFLVTDDVALAPITPTPFQRGLVSLTFDDSWISDYSQVLPLLTQQSLPATHYVITSLIGEPDRMDLPMLNELRGRGDEIAAHTATHPDLTKLSPADLANELTSSKQYLEANGFGPVANFASPYGAYSGASLAAIRSLYQSHRTTDAGYNSKDDFDIYRLNCQNMRSTTTVADVDGWVTRAAAQRAWLIITYHDVVESGGSVYSTTPAGLAAQLATIQKHGLPIVTVKQALAELIPQLQTTTP